MPWIFTFALLVFLGSAGALYLAHLNWPGFKYPRRETFWKWSVIITERQDKLLCAIGGGIAIASLILMFIHTEH